MWTCASCRSVNDLRLCALLPMRRAPAGRRGHRPACGRPRASDPGRPRPRSRRCERGRRAAPHHADRIGARRLGGRRGRLGRGGRGGPGGSLRGGRDDRSRCGARWSGRRARIPICRSHRRRDRRPRHPVARWWPVRRPILTARPRRDPGPERAGPASRRHRRRRLRGPVRGPESQERPGGRASRSSTGATTTCSSRCSTRSRPAPCRRARSPSRCARSCPQAAQHDGAPRRGGRASTPSAREVLLSDGGPIAYDTLIVATGAHHTYFGHDDWAPLAPGLKTIDDAIEIRRRILIAFEAAEREADPERRREWMTFVLVGGGPTGVELAGALGEIAHDTLRRDFRSIRPDGRADRPGRGDGPGPADLPARPVALGPKRSSSGSGSRSGRRRG